MRGLAFYFISSWTALKSVFGQGSAIVVLAVVLLAGCSDQKSAQTIRLGEPDKKKTEITSPTRTEQDDGRYQSANEAARDFLLQNNICTSENLQVAAELRKDIRALYESSSNSENNILLAQQNMDKLDEYLFVCGQFQKKLEDLSGISNLVKQYTSDMSCPVAALSRLDLVVQKSRMLYDSQIELQDESEQREQTRQYKRILLEAWQYMQGCRYEPSADVWGVDQQQIKVIRDYARNVNDFYADDLSCSDSLQDEVKALLADMQVNMQGDRAQLTEPSARLVVAVMYEASTLRLQRFVKSCGATLKLNLKKNERDVEKELDRRLFAIVREANSFFDGKPTCEAGVANRAGAILQKIAAAEKYENRNARSQANKRWRLEEYRIQQQKIDRYLGNCERLARERIEQERLEKLYASLQFFQVSKKYRSFLDEPNVCSRNWFVKAEAMEKLIDEGFRRDKPGLKKLGNRGKRIESEYEELQNEIFLEIDRCRRMPLPVRRPELPKREKEAKKEIPPLPVKNPRRGQDKEPEKRQPPGQEIPPLPEKRPELPKKEKRQPPRQEIPPLPEKRPELPKAPEEPKERKEPRPPRQPVREQDKLPTIRPKEDERKGEAEKRTRYSGKQTFTTGSAGTGIYKFRMMRNLENGSRVRVLVKVAGLPAGIRLQVNHARTQTGVLLQRDDGVSTYNRLVYGGIYILDPATKTGLDLETQRELNRAKIFVLASELEAGRTTKVRSLNLRVRKRAVMAFASKWAKTKSGKQVPLMQAYGRLPRGTRLRVNLQNIRQMQFVQKQGNQLRMESRPFIEAKVMRLSGSKSMREKFVGKSLYFRINDLNARKIVATIYSEPLPQGARKYGNLAWSRFNPQGTWAHYVEKSIQRRRNLHLIDKVPSDIKRFCPRFAEIGQAERTHFWIALTAEISRLESAFIPFTAFDEGLFDQKMKGVISSGLTQISFDSTRASCYQRSGCSLIKKQRDFYRPSKNLSCAVGIMSCLVARHGCISCQSKSGAWLGVARYWSTLQAPRKVKCSTCKSGFTTLGKRPQIVNALKKRLKFCFQQ